MYLQNPVYSNLPADFHTPGKDMLSHSPSAGFSLAGMSPFYFLHICNTTTCLGSAQTSVPSSFVQHDPVKRSKVGVKVINHVLCAREQLNEICLTLFTRNPSRRILSCLSVSMLLSGISTTELASTCKLRLLMQTVNVSPGLHPHSHPHTDLAKQCE